VRRRGLQRALIAARARLAGELGCDLLTSQAPPDSTSERNLVRMGFGRIAGAQRLPLRSRRRPGARTHRAPIVTGALRLERSGPHGEVARVSLARPEVHNAFDASLMRRAAPHLRGTRSQRSRRRCVR